MIAADKAENRGDDSFKRILVILVVLMTQEIDSHTGHWPPEEMSRARDRSYLFPIESIHTIVVHIVESADVTKMNLAFQVPHRAVVVPEPCGSANVETLSLLIQIHQIITEVLEKVVPYAVDSDPKVKWRWRFVDVSRGNRDPPSHDAVEGSGPDIELLCDVNHSLVCLLRVLNKANKGARVPSQDEGVVSRTGEDIRAVGICKEGKKSKKSKQNNAMEARILLKKEQQRT